jgi:hypothetical protein
MGEPDFQKSILMSQKNVRLSEAKPRMGGVLRMAQNDEKKERKKNLRRVTHKASIPTAEHC